MILKLLIHQWKSFRRSSFFTTGILKSILAGFIALYFLFVSIGLGYASGIMIDELFPEAEIVTRFTTLFFIFWWGYLFCRFLFQKFPTLSIQYYLPLNIPRNSLIHFLLLKSGFSLFNILPFFTILPFFFGFVLDHLTFGSSILWLVAISLMIYINNYVAFYLSRKFNQSLIVSIVLFGIVASIIGIEYYGWFDLLGLFDSFSHYFSSIPLVGILLFTLIGTYQFLYGFFRKNIYLEIAKNKKGSTDIQEFNMFNRFGRIGELMKMESKLIWRNKRPKQLLSFAIISILYFLYIMNLESFQGNGSFAIVAGIIVSGSLTSSYGQFLLSWNSNHFDLILTQNLTFNRFLKSKYYLMAMSIIVLTVVCLPYCIIKPDFFVILIVTCLYNIGVSAMLFIFISIRLSKRIDLGKGALFNYQGTSAGHFFSIMPILIVPMLIYGIFSIVGLASYGLITIALIGIVGILASPYLLNVAADDFIKYKYQLQNNLSL